MSFTSLSTFVESPLLAISNASSNVSQPVRRQHRPRNVPPPKLKIRQTERMSTTGTRQKIEKDADRKEDRGEETSWKQGGQAAKRKQKEIKKMNKGINCQWKWKKKSTFKDIFCVTLEFVVTCRFDLYLQSMCYQQHIKLFICTEQ